MDNLKFEYSIKVLLISDEKDTHELLGDTLRAIGYDTLNAATVQEAEEALVNSKIDLIIGSADMAGDSWPDFLKRIKSQKTDSPVIFITDQKDPNKNKYLEAGVDGILSKPYRIGKVEELISIVLLNFDKSSIASQEKIARVIVVDDDEGILRILNNALIILGYSPVMASSGREALEKFKKNRFDLLITDYMMPEMSGKDLVLEVKKLNPGISTIMVTGYPLAYPPGVAQTEGIDAYLKKPFRINQLKEVITNLLSNDN